MYQLTFETKGIKEAIRHLESYSQAALDEALEQALDLGADFTYLVLIGNTPVDKGLLRKSERVEKQKLIRRIGPDVNIAPYAVPVEYGHHTRSGSFVPGQFFVEKTALETAKPVANLMLNFIQSKIKANAK